MKILVLGGTEFLGRHLVDVALNHGHQVTIFNRGQTNPDLYPTVEKLRGQRDGDLSALENREWDAALDTSGYIPRVVRMGLNVLADHVAHYTFFSSISAYGDFSLPGIDEAAPLAAMADESQEAVLTFYGPLKALCEQQVHEVFGDHALVIRPGLLVGPYDPTDRFTYWVRRFSQAGPRIVPKEPRSLQLIDARDLAEWVMHLVERQKSGTFNATGPDYRFTMADFVEALMRAIPSSAAPVWIPDEFLLSHGVTEFSDLPLWIAISRLEWKAFFTIDSRRAVQAGLSCRPIEDTIRDTLLWDLRDRQGHELKVGMTSSKERELLDAWGEQLDRC